MQRVTFLLVMSISLLAVPPLVLSRRQNMPADSVRATDADEEPDLGDTARPTRPALESDAG